MDNRIFVKVKPDMRDLNRLLKKSRVERLVMEVAGLALGAYIIHNEKEKDELEERIAALEERR